MLEIKTPGVYVTEVPVLPASVAPVATAIPAFIGCTEKAVKDGESVTNKPVRIESLPEFKQIFGGPAPVDAYRVTLGEGTTVTNVESTPRFFLYDSLQLFFDNGGGPCFIVSVGGYNAESRTLAKFSGGLAALEKEDEPTLILFPDGALLKADELGVLQQQALAQCVKLQDRFGLFDLVESPTGDPQWLAGRNAFRDNIGINGLRYGAAYTPWLKVRHDKVVTFEQIKLFRNPMDPAAEVKVETLTTDATIGNLIASVRTAIDDRKKVAADVTALAGAGKTLRDKFNDVLAPVRAATTANAAKDSLTEVFKFLRSIAAAADAWIHDDAKKVGSDVYQGLNEEVTRVIGSTLAAALTLVFGYAKGFGAGAAALSLDGGFYDGFGVAPWNIPTSVPADNSLYQDAAGNVPTGATAVVEKVQAALPRLPGLFERFSRAMDAIVSASVGLVGQGETALSNGFPAYRSLVEAIKSRPTRVPPSGAIAGVYATVDRTRGVWKSPANVSLSGVFGLSEQLTNEQQGDLNVDVQAGKSINAIRFFSGKGYLVWGARTLAGNDNEWRFVSVRRLFNMVEESIQKSSSWVVFEPNDANTWVRVRGMIENFLTGLWRDGALAGEKPEQAFFVNIGLGKTMTNTDIQEGRLIIEVGLAAVRPAEFIILQFMHKMQEAS